MESSNNIKNKKTIRQSIFSLSYEFYDPRDETDSERQVQIMTSQTEFSRAEIEQHFTSSQQISLNQ